EPRILEQIRNGQRVEHYETQRKRKNGTIIEVSLTASPVRNKEGRIVGAAKILRDITDRKRLQAAQHSQRFLGAIVESAEDAIVSKTLDGIVTTWNYGAERLFGYTSEEMI